MKFWQAITWAETEQLMDIARFAEELGFEGLMSGDHALYPDSLSGGYPYSETGMPPQTADSEYADMWTSFAAMAAVTTKLRFTCGVYVLPIRNPIEVAKMSSTLANLSQGRFVLGSGTGWMKEEFDIYGVDFKTRGKRMNEMIDVMEGLWQGDMFEYHGEFFDFDAIKVTPVPKYKVPLYFGGAAPVALRRAAQRGDGWIGAGNTADEVPGLLQTLRGLRAEAGRADEPFETMVGLYGDPDLDTFKRLHEEGMTSSVAMPFPFALGERSSLDDKKRMMEAFAESTLRHFQ
jgi:probable F420-dependent oxidoreductase